MSPRDEEENGSERWWLKPIAPLLAMLAMVLALSSEESRSDYLLLLLCVAAATYVFLWIRRVRSHTRHD
jgi:hypothetical protein